MTRNLDEIQAAAKLIEADGDQGFWTTSQLYGEEIAIVLLVAHLRRSYGSMETHPASPEIERRVNDHLKEIGIRIS